MFLETSRGKYVGFILALGVTDLFEVTRGGERSSKVKVQNNKNFISEFSWIYTYIKCIIRKLSKKRVRPTLYPI